MELDHIKEEKVNFLDLSIVKEEPCVEENDDCLNVGVLRKPLILNEPLPMCPECKTSFLNTTRLQKHMQKEHKSLTENTSTSVPGLEKIKKRRKITQKKNLPPLEHYIKQEENKKKISLIRCPLCPAHFMSHKIGLDHLRVHLAKHRYDEKAAKNYKKDQEGNIILRPYHCSICNGSYTNEYRLKYHMTTKHKDDLKLLKDLSHVSPSPPPLALMKNNSLPNGLRYRRKIQYIQPQVKPLLEDDETGIEKEV